MSEAPVLTQGPILVEYFDDHWYKVVVEGKTHWLPSVTTKLGIVEKEGLARWRGDVGNREADLRLYDAQQRGKRIHWGWEVAQKGGAVVYDPWQNPVFTAEGLAELKAQYKELAILRTQDEMVQIGKLKRWFETVKPRIVSVETRVWDLDERDAGTIDSVYWIEEGEYLVNGAKPVHLVSGVYIVDLKTGKTVDRLNVWLQHAPYGKMWEKIHGMQIAGAITLHTTAQTRGGIQGLATLVRDRQTLFEKDYPDYRHAAAIWERNHADDQPDQFQFPAILTLEGGITWQVMATQTSNPQENS